MTWPRPFQGQFVICRMGLAVINPHIKFEASAFTHYKDIKSNVKCRNWGGFKGRGHPRSLAMSQFDRVHMTSYSTNKNYASILYHNRVIMSYLSNVADFNLSTCIWCPHWGDCEFHPDLWHQKTRVIPGLSCDIACVILCLSILIQYWHVTNRWTDRQTNGHMMIANTVLAQHCAVIKNNDDFYIYHLKRQKLILHVQVLWRCWLGGRKGIRLVKNWVVGCWHGCLGWGADLHIAQQMPLPLTVSCSSKSRLVLPLLVLPFWYLLTRVVPDKFQKSSKTVVLCVFCLFLVCLGHEPVQ